MWANKATSANVEIPLKADAGWLIDRASFNQLAHALAALSTTDPHVHTSCIPFPTARNEHLEWTAPSKCELATVLHRVSKLSILGDYSPRFETVALDNVKVSVSGWAEHVSMVKLTHGDVCGNCNTAIDHS